MLVKRTEMTDGGGGNGMIGINASIAERNIKDFEESAHSALDGFKNAFKYLFSELYDIWASSDAHDFSITHNHNFISLVADFERAIYENVKSARRAYNILAEANGAKKISSDCIYSYDMNTGPLSQSFAIVLLRSKDGVTGMNTQLVSIVSAEFSKKWRAVVEALDSIPTKIAIYDNSDEVANTYYVKTSGIVYRVKNEADRIVSDIKHYIETESDNIILASHQATDAINTVQI